MATGTPLQTASGAVQRGKSRGWPRGGGEEKDRIQAGGADPWLVRIVGTANKSPTDSWMSMTQGLAERTVWRGARDGARERE